MSMQTPTSVGSWDPRRTSPKLYPGPDDTCGNATAVPHTGRMERAGVVRYLTYVNKRHLAAHRGPVGFGVFHFARVDTDGRVRELFLR